ncbi:hypothetical protein ACFRAO_20410 [Streptomyces sp. NPDC056656]|uniref:hypothetical protein n=1 Tax=Streptomyces sp. NPDC056656 TaxID=3345895 RepID=UPI0036943BCB
MEWFIGIGVLGGLALITAGAASMRTGWTPPWSRVTRPSVYGLGTLLVGVPCVVQGLFYFRTLPSPPWEVRFFGLNVLVFSGLILIGVSQMRRRR